MFDAKKLEKQESLPFPPTPSGSVAGRTMQESIYKPQAKPRRLPADAPNILVVLIDDAGPALPSTFGGEVNTPTMDRIVAIVSRNADERSASAYRNRDQL